jgi:hypothetical protein
MRLVDLGVMGGCDARTQGAAIAELLPRPRTRQRARPARPGDSAFILRRPLSAVTDPCRGPDRPSRLFLVESPSSVKRGGCAFGRTRAKLLSAHAAAALTSAVVPVAIAVVEEATAAASATAETPGERAADLLACARSRIRNAVTQTVDHPEAPSVTTKLPLLIGVASAASKKFAGSASQKKWTLTSRTT